MPPVVVRMLLTMLSLILLTVSLLPRTPRVVSGILVLVVVICVASIVISYILDKRNNI